MTTIGVSTTTINEPRLLVNYAMEAQRLKERTGISTFFVVAGDRITPPSAEKLCQSIEQTYAIEVEYLTPRDQLNLFENQDSITSLVRWDCIQRRNFAGYRALQKGATVVVYLDDDNLIQDSTYFEHHLEALTQPIEHGIQSSTGYFNIMQTAVGNGLSNRTFPRGYPFEIRREAQEEAKVVRDSARVAANAGLWTEEADIDAVTRIASRPQVHEYSLPATAKLAKGTWTPLNSQNTAFLAEFMVGYYLSDQVGRYDDIYAGYVFQKLINYFDFTTSFGFPIVRQERNEHDLLIDLDQELGGMRNVDFVLEFIRSIPMRGVTPYDAMRDFTRNWEIALIDLPRKHHAESHLRSLLHGYQIWIEAISKIDKFS